MWIGEMRGDVCSLNRRIVEVVEIIDDCDSPIAFGHQTIDEVRADESRAASDENAPHVSFQLSAYSFQLSTRSFSENWKLKTANYFVA